MQFKIPLEEHLIEALNSLKETRQNLSFRVIIESELVKLHRTTGLESVLKANTHNPQIYAPPKSASRILIRITDEALLEELNRMTSIMNRATSTILYSLLRAIVINNIETQSADNNIVNF